MVERFTMSDGVSIVCHRFPAKGIRRGAIVFVHGIRSHAGWYEQSCRQLSEAGYDVVFPDRRGAGANSEQRGDCPSFRRLLDDVIDVVKHENQIRKPVFVVGISWGGKLAISLPYRSPGIVDGIALITPGIVPKIGLSVVEKSRIAITRLIRPTQRYQIPLNDPTLFTASPDWRAFIETDPNGLREATARFFFNSVQLDLYVRRALKSVTCPVLLLSAGRDRIADATKSKSILKSKVKSLTAIDYPDAEHTLEFEPGCPYVSDLITWLTERR